MAKAPHSGFNLIDDAGDPANEGDFQRNGDDLKFKDSVAVRTLLHDGDPPTAHTLASHSTKAHSELTGVTPDLHHAQAHSLASHSTKAHSELTGVTSDLHHAQLHAAAHKAGQADAFHIGEMAAPAALAQYVSMVLPGVVISHDDSSPKALFVVQDGDIVRNIWVLIQEIWDGATPGTIKIGDGDDDNGFATNLSINPYAPGYHLNEWDIRGDYLWDPINSHKRDKIYEAPDTIDAFLVINDSTQGQLTVWVEILRLK